MINSNIDFSEAVFNIRQELKSYIKANGIKSLVLGVSGGIDSCLCAALAKPVCDELKIPLIGRSLPIITNEDDEIDRSEKTGSAFCHRFTKTNLNQQYYVIKERLNPGLGDNEADRINDGNLKARLRMMYLYNLAAKTGGMVLSTDNYTEYLLGFWTLHGDVGDYGMIQNLWKTEVYDMAEWLAENEYAEDLHASEILKETINSLATDGLGVTKEGDLGQILPCWEGNSRDGYKKVDSELMRYIHFGEADLDSEIIHRHLKTSFKRNNPYNIKRDKIFKK